MICKEQNQILDAKIESNINQYKVDRLDAEISAFSSGYLNKYNFLTRKDLKYKPNALDKARCEFSPVGKAFRVGLDKTVPNYQKEGVIKLLTNITDNLAADNRPNNDDNRPNNDDNDNDNDDNKPNNDDNDNDDNKPNNDDNDNDNDDNRPNNDDNRPNNDDNDNDDYKEFNYEKELEKLENLDKRFKRLIDEKELGKLEKLDERFKKSINKKRLESLTYLKEESSNNDSDDSEYLKK